MNKLDLSKDELTSLREKLLAQINKQQEPTPKQKYNQAIYNRTWNPETMPADRLREFQSHGWFVWMDLHIHREMIFQPPLYKGREKTT